MEANFQRWRKHLSHKIYADSYIQGAQILNLFIEPDPKLIKELASRLEREDVGQAHLQPVRNYLYAISIELLLKGIVEDYCVKLKKGSVDLKNKYGHSIQKLYEKILNIIKEDQQFLDKEHLSILREINNPKLFLKIKEMAQWAAKYFVSHEEISKICAEEKERSRKDIQRKIFPNFSIEEIRQLEGIYSKLREIYDHIFRKLH